VKVLTEDEVRKLIDPLIDNKFPDLKRMGKTWDQAMEKPGYFRVSIAVSVRIGEHPAEIQKSFEQNGCCLYGGGYRYINVEVYDKALINRAKELVPEIDKIFFPGSSQAEFYHRG